jgi:hypothetical protein
MVLMLAFLLAAQGVIHPEGVRLACGSEGRWHEADGECAYIELTFDEVHYNVRSR